jgi:acyl carrier protein
LKTLGAFIAAGGLFWLWAWLAEARSRKVRDGVFVGREAGEEERSFQAFFKSAGIPLDVALEIKAIMADELGEDLSRLRPTDDFSKNLRPLLNRDSMADVAILTGLERRFHIKIDDDEAEACKTVADIVVLVHDKARTRNAI